MKKFAVLMVSMCCLFASESRVKSLGDVKDFLVDPSLTYLYPSLLVRFPDMLWVEFTDSSIQNLPYVSFAGVNIKFHEKAGVFSFIYNYPSYTYPYVTSYPLKEQRESRGFEIIWAKSITQKIDLGTAISLNYINEEITDTTLSENPILTVRNIEFMPGISYTISKDKKIDFSLHFSTNSFYQEYYSPAISDTIDGKGNSFYGLNIRYTMGIGEYSNFIFGLHYYSYPQKYTESSGTSLIEFNQKKSELNFNLGYYTEPLENLKVITGINLSYTTIDTTHTEGVTQGKGSLDAFYINGILGAEIEFGKHFEFRSGVRKSLLKSIKDKDYDIGGTGKDALNQEEFNIELGFSFIKDDLRFDGVMGKQVLFRGPFFISGKESGLFSTLSISYNFSLF
jgi:hypothetical protein